jgi:hypothetical protein
MSLSRRKSRLVEISKAGSGRGRVGDGPSYLDPAPGPAPEEHAGVCQEHKAVLERI